MKKQTIDPRLAHVRIGDALRALEDVDEADMPPGLVIPDMVEALEHLAGVATQRRVGARAIARRMIEAADAAPLAPGFVVLPMTPTPAVYEDGSLHCQHQCPAYAGGMCRLVGLVVPLPDEPCLGAERRSTAQALRRHGSHSLADAVDAWGAAWDEQHPAPVDPGTGRLAEVEEATDAQEHAQAQACMAGELAEVSGV